MSSVDGKDFIEFHRLPTRDLMQVIRRANFMAEAWSQRQMPQILAGMRVALIVDDGGWRNTAAFDLGIHAMGGICVHTPITFGTTETINDLAGYLDNWFDLLIVRTKELAVLQQLGAAAQAPVINARTRSNHPCETLGDLAYIDNMRGHLDGLKVAAVTPDANILRSWAEASIALPIKVTQVFPEKWHLKDAGLLNANFRSTTNMKELLDTDIVLTDSWPTDATDNELKDFRIDAALLDKLPSEAIFIPCPPIARGQEVTVEAMTHPRCQSRHAKAFLLHAQNALLEWAVA